MNDQPESTGKMRFQDYLEALGHHDGGKWLCMQCALPTSVPITIKQGKPIAASYAHRICDYLSKEFEREITPDDIANIKIINPGKENKEYHSSHTRKRDTKS
jgi:hypothetical protein